MSTGFQVFKRKRQVDPALAEKFRMLPVANISDSMQRLIAGGPRLRPLHAGGAMSGPAVTVKTRPGDNLMTHMALNLAREGDVIVVDAGADLTNAIIGERMIAYCVARKFAGIVINGAVRDSAWIKAHNFPVYAAGITHRGPYKDGPGEINVPVAFDGMVIEPGDLVVGDDDGLVCVSYEHAQEIYEKALAKFNYETETFPDIGKTDNDSAGYTRKLKALGCYFEE